ncbi:Tol-Pal system beta propeller repeat protein TolB [Oceaniglobus roseus]|uniref:Tol-Pal system beta propeller repeat protein TolB n=1 Tax=Oceaniglobus roseus TaxID=1737570 RepID=UPI000C7F2444|nr:Tol-Pal system beta propeller repeat protein TolB [Kandeliimicrobium roseum]
MTSIRILAAALALLGAVPAAPTLAQDGPLRIDITEGVIEPLPFAVPDFIAENPGGGEYAARLSRVIAADLAGTGLFREIPADAFITQVSDFSPTADYASWKAINAQALITGAVSATADGQLTVKFRVFDVFAESQLGEGLQFNGTTASWRRMAHKVADAVYSRITGEGGYFDSRVVYVSETGPKNDRKKRLAVMDYDGANVQYLTNDSAIVLAPRFSPTGDRILYTSYETGFPQIYQLDVGSVSRVSLPVPADSMTFAPRYAPDGQTVIFSASQGGNTDLYRLRPGGQPERLTNSPSIETAPSYSPDGSQIVFESDRSGAPQLYVMPANGGEPRRISFGEGRYGTPVWSPRGDLIAFTKQNAGRFHIGVMRTDGSEERLLTASFLDEGPTWAPNGRVLMFMRESAGAGGESSLYSVDISGRNLKKVPLEGNASDPAWSPLLK